MPIIRSKIPGTNKIRLVRYPESLMPRLNKTPMNGKLNSHRQTTELANDDDKKWLEEGTLEKPEGELMLSITTNSKKRQ